MFTFKTVGQTGIYTRKPPGYGQIIPIEFWRIGVEDQLFTDDDGYGYAYKDGRITVDNYTPSQQDSIPVDATHILWMNR